MKLATPLLFLLTGGIVVTAACGGGSTEPGDVPPETNTRPTVTVTLAPSSPKLTVDLAEWRISAVDSDAEAENQLARIILSFGDGEEQERIVTGQAASAQFFYTYTEPGDFQWSVVAEDQKGLSSGTRTGTVEVLANRELTFTATRFFADDSNAGLVVEMTHTSTGQEFSGTTDAAGELTLTVPEGAYTLQFDDPNDHDLHRTNIVHEPTGAVCQVSDMADSPITFSVEGDASYRVETVDGDIDMATFSQGWGNRAATARSGQNIVTAMYEGRDGAGSERPPGLAWGDLARDTTNAKIAVDAWNESISRPGGMCGGTPYEFIFEFVPSEDWAKYTGWNPESAVIDPNESVQWIFADQSNLESPTTRQLDVGGQLVNYIKASIQSHGGGRPRNFTSESTVVGWRADILPPACTTSDEFLLDGCDYSGAMTFKDEQFYAIAAHFVGRAQEHGLNPWVDPEQAPSVSTSSATSYVAR